MRPVNLIPPEDRRGDHAPLRAGSLAYVVVGAFAVALLAVVAMVLTQNSITSHENEIAELEVASDAAAQRAEALAPYAEFANLQAQREQTIKSLAESRFDWERVLRELALVIPGGITLVGLDAASAGEVSEGTGSVDASAASAPRMVMSGCGTDHATVAEFVAALEDIDGVTRVGLEKSAVSGGLPGEAAAAAVPGGETCAGGPKVANFAVSAVFDGVTPLSVDPAAPAAPTLNQTNSVDEQIEESRKAANLVPGTAR